MLEIHGEDFEDAVEVSGEEKEDKEGTKEEGADGPPSAAPPSNESGDDASLVSALRHAIELMDPQALTRCVAGSNRGAGFFARHLPGLLLRHAVDAPRLALACVGGYEPKGREEREGKGASGPGAGKERKEAVAAERAQLRACSLLVESLAAMRVKQAEEEGREKVPALPDSVRNQAKSVAER